jgi:preprotein translocase subunit SecG
MKNKIGYIISAISAVLIFLQTNGPQNILSVNTMCLYACFALFVLGLKIEKWL